MQVRWFAVAGIACAGIIGAAYAAHRTDPKPVEAPQHSQPPLVTSVQELHVPKLAGPIAIDGETDDTGWRTVARTNAFLNMRGQPARPYSDARLAWGDGKLWILLYAADEDIESETDSFHVELGGHVIDVNPVGKVNGNAQAAHDLDGTLDDPKDDDEEWVIELAVPLDTIGLQGKPGERISFSVRRCDTPHASTRTCAQWGEAKPGILVLEGP